MGKALITYIKGAFSELRKVQWPTPKETWRYSVIVIGVSAAVTAFLAASDYIFGVGVDLIP